MLFLYLLLVNFPYLFKCIFLKVVMYQDWTENEWKHSQKSKSYLILNKNFEEHSHSLEKHWAPHSIYFSKGLVEFCKINMVSVTPLSFLKKEKEHPWWNKSFTMAAVFQSDTDLINKDSLIQIWGQKFNLDACPNNSVSPDFWLNAMVCD